MSDWITHETYEALINVFLTPPGSNSSSDDRGHSQQLQFRVSPELARRAAVMASSPKMPYETLSDLLRHCLVVGMAIADIRGEVPESEQLIDSYRAKKDWIRDFSSKLTEIVFDTCKYHSTGISNMERASVQVCKKSMGKLPPDTFDDVIVVMKQIFGDGVVPLLVHGRVSDELMERVGKMDYGDHAIVPRGDVRDFN